jgi:DNA-directed RNA polymerase specialized sigma24 family protein
MIVAEKVPDIQTPPARKIFFEELYQRAFPRVAKFVSSRNGSFQDAKDIFQDSLVIYYEKVLDQKLELYVSEEAYVLGIAKHLWLRKFNREKDLVSLNSIESSIEIADEYFPSIETSKLTRFLERTGKKCMDLLQAFYYKKDSMEQITDNFGYRSTHSATVQKFKCLEKMRDTVKQNSMHYEDFTE